MLKRLFVFLLGMLIWKGAAAQISQKDTLVGYMKTSGKVVANKDSADYYMLIMPLDSSSGQKLFPVIQFYKNGKTKMVGQSLNQDTRLRLQGKALSYYPNGRKQSIINYEDGSSIGDAIKYYPNGQLWKLTTYQKDDLKNKIFFNKLLKECRDSTGKVLAENGNGTWLDFDEDFKHQIAEGKVVNGLENGEWHGTLSDTTGFVCTYKAGEVVGTGYGYHKSGTKYPFTKVIVQPEFKGGIEAFGRFLATRIKFPRYERENGISGRAIVSFVVEKDGSLSDFNVIRTPSQGFGEESIRVLKLSPKWTPGYDYGIPRRVSYTVPIAFALGEAPPNR